MNMKTISGLSAVAALFAVLALPGVAYADGTCMATAMDKKLAGAAKSSFMKKCERDAAAVCSTTAADKKLSGAAKTSFTKKCVKDAVSG